MTVGQEAMEHTTNFYCSHLNIAIHNYKHISSVDASDPDVGH